LAVTSTAHAHEKWFLAGDLPGMAARGYLSPFCIAGAVVGILVTILAGYFCYRRGGRDLLPGPERLGATPDGLTRFYAFVPLIIGVHFAVPLLVLGVQGKLFSPNNQPPTPWNFFLGTWEIAIALSLLYGGLTRLFSVALAVLWLVAGFSLGWEIAFENLHYLGAAVFFFCAGRGPYSIDRLLFPSLEPKPALTLRAMPILRICFGLSLAFVAFTEKLANPDLALAFLGQYQLNFTHALGLPLSDRSFIWCAGTAELVIGLFLAFGIFPRLIIVAAWGIINLTLTIFSWVELVGHLPIYGIMAVLLVWEPTETTKLAWQQGVLGRQPAG
jgi:uncharacterized membrane protein YphA (DoxX/SURF4 family)